MAEGIRVRHELATNTMFVVTDIARPYGEPFACLKCNTIHTHKTYHLQIDDAGSVVVSQGIWEQIQRLPNQGGFELANVVKDPPNQKLSMNQILEVRRG